jgi:hypothetical protein
LRRGCDFSILDFMNQRELQVLHSQTWSRPWANWIIDLQCSSRACFQPELSKSQMHQD